MRPPRSRLLAPALGAFALGTAALWLAACGRPAEPTEIRVEHVPKEPPAPKPAGNTTATPTPSAPAPSGTVNVAATPPSPTPPASLPPSAQLPSTTPSSPGMAALPGMAEFVAATPTPKWSPPADWQAQPASSVRKGTWLIPPPAGVTAQPAEVSVNVFQGQLGGLLANVNRWRGQVSLPADLTEAKLPESIQTLTVGGRTVQLVNLDGPDGRSLAGALVFLPDRVWSFRLSGNTAIVAPQRPAFQKFIESIQWQD